MLSTGPVFAIASNKGNTQLDQTNTQVWASAGRAIDVGRGWPLAVWAGSTGVKVVLQRDVPFVTSAVDDVLVEDGVERVIGSASFAGDRSFDRSAAAFDAAGQLHYLRETATGFRLTWGARQLEWAVDRGVRVGAQWVRWDGARVHVGWTEEDERFMPPRLDLHTIALEDGAVVWDRVVSLSEGEPPRSPAFGERGSAPGNL